MLAFIDLCRTLSYLFFLSCVSFHSYPLSPIPNQLPPLKPSISFPYIFECHLCPTSNCLFALRFPLVSVLHASWITIAFPASEVQERDFCSWYIEVILWLETIQERLILAIISSIWPFLTREWQCWDVLTFLTFRYDTINSIQCDRAWLLLYDISWEFLGSVPAF